MWPIVCRLLIFDSFYVLFSIAVDAVQCLSFITLQIRIVAFTLDLLCVFCFCSFAFRCNNVLSD